MPIENDSQARLDDELDGQKLGHGPLEVPIRGRAGEIDQDSGWRGNGDSLERRELIRPDGVEVMDAKTRPQTRVDGEGAGGVEARPRVTAISTGSSVARRGSARQRTAALR